MKTVILDGMHDETKISKAVRERFTDEGSSYHVLRELNILACKSCGVCGHKTPGECAFQDDMTDVLRNVANCDIILMLTPVTFGGYSSHLKKAVDKFMVLGEAMYMVKKGHLLHPMRYGQKKIIAIGVETQEIDEQQACFDQLAAHNALNMECTYKTAFIKPEASAAQINMTLDTILSEVAS